MVVRAGPAAVALLNDIAEFVSSYLVVSKRFFLENAMRNQSTTLCRGITRQVLSSVPLRARLNGHPMVAGLPVPTVDLVPIADGQSLFSFSFFNQPPNLPLTTGCLPRSTPPPPPRHSDPA